MQVITDPTQINRKKPGVILYNNHPHGTIFHTPEMYEIVSKDKIL
jgi:hypothetical protein